MYAMKMPNIYDKALAFFRKKKEHAGRGEMKALLGKLGASRATFYRAIREGDATARASEFMAWLDILGAQLVLPGEATYPVTEIDQQCHRRLRGEIPDNMIRTTAERAFPAWSVEQRESTVRGVLEGSVPLTVGLYYAIANAVLDSRPGEQLDRAATELMTGLVTTEINETPQCGYKEGATQKARAAKGKEGQPELSSLAPASGRMQEQDAPYETRRTANGDTSPRK